MICSLVRVLLQSSVWERGLIMEHTVGFAWLEISDGQFLIGSGIAFRKQSPQCRPRGRLLSRVLDRYGSITIPAWWWEGINLIHERINMICRVTTLKSLTMELTLRLCSSSNARLGLSLVHITTTAIHRWGRYVRYMQCNTGFWCLQYESMMRTDLTRKGLWGSALVVKLGHGIQHALYALVSS